MSANPKYDDYVTEAEYLELERNSEIRNEYIQGEIVAMAGASPNHNEISMTLSYLLYGHLRNNKDCKAYGESMRIKIEQADVQTYPDFSIVCGERQFTDDNPPALLNPIILIEILSPSTEQYDRGKKFQFYRQISSLQEYILIAQDSAHIERFTRKTDNLWEFTETIETDTSLSLQSIDLSLNLAEVYENVTFEET